MNYFGDRSQFSAQKSLGIGALSGTIAGVITCPTDIIRTRILSARPETGQPLVSIRETMRSIYTTEGPRYFFRGVIPRIMLCAPNHGCYMLAFEFLRHKFVMLHARLNDPPDVTIPRPVSVPTRQTTTKIIVETTEPFENALEHLAVE